MDENELQRLIQQIMAGRQQGTQRPQPRPPVQIQGFGGPRQQQPGGWGTSTAHLEEDKLAMMRGQYNAWLGTGGIGAIGPDPGSAPPFIKEILQRPGMKLDQTQYHSVGGYTPRFAQAANDVLYPGMNFRTDDQSRMMPMTQGSSQPIPLGGEVNAAGPPMQQEHPYSGFSRSEFDRLQAGLNNPQIDAQMKKRILEEYLNSGGTLL